jgi:UDP-N-acetylmuramoylalanine--D-glutamate ligase
VAVARWLVARGAQVTVTDQKGEDELRPALEALAGLPVRFALGGEREAELLGADLVIKNPAIPPSSPWVARLAAAGVPVTAEIALALAQVRVPYAVVTGSKGKSTTSTLLGAMLEGDGSPACVAGNNERPLLAEVEGLDPPARLVVEVSSFMAEALRDARAAGARFPRPAALVVTSLSPEHLNWHGTLEAYYGAKLSLLELEPELVVWAGEDPESARVVPPAAGARAQARGWLEPGAAARPGDVVVAGERIERLLAGGARRGLLACGDLRLLGRHNLQNALLAAAAADALGAAPAAIAAGARAFAPLPHRLEPVGVSRRGVRFVNDSTATTPEAAIAALEAVPPPVVVLLGGRTKGADYAQLASVAARRAAVAVCLGEMGPTLADLIAGEVRAGRGGAEVVRVAGGFDEAFAEGLARCPAGGALLLAPGCTSYDMFGSFKARGERFRRLAQEAGQE